jgi:zinc transport system substrate-binding protein
MRIVLSLAVSIALACLGAAGGGCAPSEPPPATGEKISVFVSIPPLADFVQRIGGDRVAVSVLVPPGQSPHTYEPTPRQMTELAQAKVFFAIGLPFEKLLTEKLTAANPNLRIANLRSGIKLRQLTPEEAHAEEADEPHAEKAAEPQRPGSERPAAEPDPHVWLSPKNMHIIASTIAVTLAQIDFAHAEQYSASLQALQKEISAVDARIAQALAPLRGKEFFVFHPAFGYFGDAYGLKQVPVEVEGKEPGARQLAEFIREAKARGVKVIFVQPQFSTRSAEAVARAIGGAVVPMDDLARDTLGNLEVMAAEIQKALSAGTPQEDTK